MKNRSALITGSILFLLFGFALALRYLAHCWEPMISRDGIFYLRLAENWEQLTTERTINLSLYSYFIYLLGRLGVPSLAAALGLSMLFGSLVPVAGYGTARNIPLSKTYAVGIGMLLAINPALIGWSAQIMREGLFLGLFSLGVWAATRREMEFYLVAGALLSLSSLCRWEGLTALVAITGEFIWRLLREPERRRKILADYVAFGSAYAMIFVVFGYLSMGIWVYGRMWGKLGK